MKILIKSKIMHYLNLLKDYYMKKSLLITFFELTLLGNNSRTLHILHLSTGIKTTKILKKRYYSKLLEFDKNYNENIIHKKSDKVWFCWFQGLENAPEIVQICYKSIKKNLPDKEIILITEKNMLDYVTFPDYILQKWKSGTMTNAHMSDLLRIELLIKYGGLWLDATIFCSDSDIPNYIFNSDLFFYQCLWPNSAGNTIVNASFLMSAFTNNKILMATKYLCYEYWKENSRIIDYFLLHYFMSIVLNYYIEDFNKIIPVDSNNAHMLQNRLFDTYNDEIWKFIKNTTCFHKLTYRFDEDKLKLKNTYYKRVLGE